MGKRKDSKGRVLKTGESQRKNGTYEFRWQDANGKRHSVYAPTLDELRQKETEIQRDIMDGIDHSAGQLTALELFEKYIALKQHLSQKTREQYSTLYNTLNREPFMQRKINSIKQSDAKLFIIKLHNDGRAYSTIQTIFSRIHSAFEMAVDDDMIRKNPFRFKISDVITKNTTPRQALTPHDEKVFLEYAADFPCYNIIVVLLGTGIRVSELCGLTLLDIDFENRRINVDKQLLRTPDGMYYVTTPKTQSGMRYIPIMNEAVYNAFQSAVRNRQPPKVEMMVNGYSGFLFLNRLGRPQVAYNIIHSMKFVVSQYNKSHAVQLPHVTPHILRHTFCSRMAAAGMKPKQLQYLMGHSNIQTTLNIYAHCDYEVAEKEMERVLQLSDYMAL